MNLTPLSECESIDELQTKSKASAFAYEVLKTVVEKRWCKLFPDKYAFFNGDEVQILTTSATKDYFKCCPKIKVVGKRTKQHADGSETTEPSYKYYPFFKRWEADHTIRKLDSIYFDVSTTDSRPRCYNTWKGFAIARDSKQEEFNKDEELKFILDHIKRLCGGDTEPEAYEYFINWLAHMFQKPEEKPQTYPIFGGRQGIGKTKLEELVTNMIGQTAVVKSSKFDMLFGKFNGAVSKKLLVICNEGDSNSSKQFAEVIKDFADTKVIYVQKKYGEATSENSYHRLWMVTNHANNFGTIGKGERRPFFLYASSYVLNLPQQEREEYCTKLANHVDNKQVQRAFYKFLMSRDLSDFNPRVAVKTKFHKQREKTSTPLLVRFLVGVLSDEHGKLTFQSSQLYNRFTTWLTEQGQQYSRSNKAFSQELKSYNIDSGKKLIEFKKSGCMWIMLDKKQLLEYIQNQYDYTGDDEDTIIVDRKTRNNELEEEVKQLKDELKKKQTMIDQLEAKLKRLQKPIQRLQKPRIRYQAKRPALAQ